MNIQIRQTKLRSMFPAITFLSFCLLLGGDSSFGQDATLAGDVSSESLMWSDTSGKFQVSATFIRLDKDKVVLKKSSDDKEISIPLTKLSPESQKQVWTEAAKKKSTQRSSTAGSLKSKEGSTGTSSTGVAMKPMSLSKTPITIPASISAAAYLKLVEESLQKNDWMIVWDGLPSDYQKDVAEIIAVTSQKVDAKTLAPLARVRKDIVTILRTKKKFIMAMQKKFVESQSKQPGATSDGLDLGEKLYDPLVDLVEAYVPAELFEGKKIQAADIRSTLVQYLANIQSKFQRIIDMVGAENPMLSSLAGQTGGLPKMNIESETSNEATLIVEAPNQPKKTIKWIRHNERWVPADVASSWQMTSTQAKQQLEQLTPAMLAEYQKQAMAGIVLVNGTTAGLLQAQDQESFEEALSPITSMLPMLMGGFPPAP